MFGRLVRCAAAREQSRSTPPAPSARIADCSDLETTPNRALETGSACASRVPRLNAASSRPSVAPAVEDAAQWDIRARSLDLNRGSQGELIDGPRPPAIRDRLVRGTAELLAHDRPVGFTSGHDLEAVPSEYRRDTGKQISRVPGDIGVDRIRLQRTSSTTARRIGRGVEERRGDALLSVGATHEEARHRPHRLLVNRTEEPRLGEPRKVRSWGNQAPADRHVTIECEKPRRRPSSCQLTQVSPVVLDAAGCGIPDRAGQYMHQQPFEAPARPNRSSNAGHVSTLKGRTSNASPTSRRYSSAPPPSTDVTRRQMRQPATRPAPTRPNRNSHKQRSGVPRRCPERRVLQRANRATHQHDRSAVPPRSRSWTLGHASIHLLAQPSGIVLRPSQPERGGLALVTSRSVTSLLDRGTLWIDDDMYRPRRARQRRLVAVFGVAPMAGLRRHCR